MSNNSNNQAKKNNPKNKNRRKRKNKTPSQREGLTLVPYVHLSDCTKLFARAVADPFGLYFSKQLPCIPTFPAFPSHKFCCFTRTTVHTGTAKIGWVSIEPHQLANDRNAIYYTDATFTGNSLSLSATGVIGKSQANSPFNAGAIGGSRQYRTVGCGLRVRFRGKELNRSGVYTVARHPNGIAWSSGTTQDGVLAYAGTAHEPVSSTKWNEVHYRPASPSDCEYGTTVPASGLGSLVIFFDIETAGDTFDVETVSFYEVIGADVGSLTETEADANGFYGVMSSVRDAAATHARKIDYVPFLRAIGNKILQSGSYVFMNYARNQAIKAIAGSAVPGGQLLLN